MKSRSQKFRLYKRKVLFLNFLLMTRQTLTHSALKHMKEIYRALHLWNLKNRNRLKQNHLCTVYMSHYSNVSHNPFPVSCITCAWNDRQWLCEGLYMCSFHPFYKPCSVDYVETSMIYWEMSDSYTYTYICVWIPLHIGFIQWEVKQMKTFGDWTPILRVTKWSKGSMR